jgi:NADH-quinone oxidoreductase subunit G
VEQVRKACLADRDVSALLSNRISALEASPVAKPQGIQRIADVPIYFADPIVRRSPPLQRTRAAKTPRAWMNARLMARLGIAKGQKLRVKQGPGSAILNAALDDKMPDECVRIPAAHAATAGLGAMFGTVSLEKISVEKAA